MNTRTEIPASQPDNAEFSTLLDDWAAAIVANDADRIAAFATPDWVITGPESGPGNLADYLTAVRSKELMHSAMDFTVIEARVKGDVAAVLTHSTNRGTWNGESFASDEWATEIFFRIDGDWRCTMTSLTPNYQSPIARR